MNQDDSSPTKNQDSHKREKKSEADEDPKPRIVLTFRSEKTGAKNSNMKIISAEEKQEEISPRRSGRTRNSKWEDVEFENKTSISPKKDKSPSENDEASDSSQTTLKRSTRHCSKEFTDVLANAIARKKKSYNETPAPQRLSRRIKPTAKVLENEELRIGLENQNSARQETLPEKSEEGIPTRRSGSSKSNETETDKKAVKRKAPDSKGKDRPSKSKSNSVMKLKHLCELGLKAIQDDEEDSDKDADSPQLIEDDNVEEVEDEAEDIEDDADTEEIDDDTEVISKLLEADEETEESSDEDYSCSVEASQGEAPRRSRRLCSTFVNDSEPSSPQQPDEEQTTWRRSSRRSGNQSGNINEEQERSYPPKRKIRYMRSEDEESEPDQEISTWWRSSRRFGNQSDNVNEDQDSNPADGDEGSEASVPESSKTIACSCLCEETTNIYAAPSSLNEPVFCQAIESVDDMRVGCSHPAQRDERGDVAPLRRASPRAPFFLACRLHAAQLLKHMCCAACGIFCTQGTFNRCSEGHLYHLECSALPHSAVKVQGGCPHCGLKCWTANQGCGPCWAPANTDCRRVRLNMQCRRRVLLPDQREQCVPAYLGFTEHHVVQGPVIPEDLLPSPPIDVNKLCEVKDGEQEELDTKPVQQLYDAILAGETADQLIPKIVRGEHINAPLKVCDGGTCVHAAASQGHLAALYLLQYAGASLDAVDTACRTPLMRAIVALLDKEEQMDIDDHEEEDTKTNIKEEKETTEDVEEAVTVEDVKEIDDKKEEEDNEAKIEQKKIPKKIKRRRSNSEEDYLKVIRYLLAAGCDPNLPGPEGMTALHMAAQLGGQAVCTLLLDAGAAADARDRGGWSPLVRAAEHDHDNVVRLLVSRGAEPACTDEAGNGALHWCALAGSARALPPLLLAAPQHVDVPNVHGDTPLHIAAREGQYACVIVLLAHGARTDVQNAGGQLPVEVCSGACQTALLLNMQLAQAARAEPAPRPHRILASDISNGREPFPVPCVNEVDDEPLPADFTYVSRHVMPEQVNIDHTLQTMQGCTCTGGSCGSCGSADSGCSCCVLGVRRWYSGGRLLPAFPHHDQPMIFECNHTCGCNLKKCENTAVSRIEEQGSLGVRVCVFRTAGGARGWGLRARERVPRGSPVALYCGELLPRARADARHRDFYMFELDLKPELLDQCGEKTPLCVDAARFGSAARFVNHSCRPSLAPVRVFTRARDLRLPAVALFALRDIAAGEELTFDYGDKFWSVKNKWMKCECGTPECRYPTIATEETDA